MTLYRKTSIYIYNLVVPTFILVALGITAIIYPSSENEKPVLLIHVLLAYTVYQLVLADHNPLTFQFPYIGLFLMYSMILTMFHQLAACVILRIHNFKEYYGEHPPKIIIVSIIRPISIILKKNTKIFSLDLS